MYLKWGTHKKMRKFDAVTELVNTLKPENPVYCFRPNSIKKSVEFFKNNLLILSSTAMNLKNLSDNLKDQLIKESEEKLSTVQVSDKERYVLSHKIDALRNIN